MKYTIPVRSMAFAIEGAADRDVRYHLNAVRVSGTDCTGTDGHMMLRIRDEAQVAPQPLLIPCDAVTWAIKAARTSKAGVVDVTRTGEDLLLEVCGQSLRATAVEDRWPDVDCIIPTAYAKDVAAAFGGALLARFVKAAKVVDKHAAIRIMPNGDAAAPVDFPGSPVPCFGVIMPRRDSTGVPVTFPEAK